MSTNNAAARGSLSERFKDLSPRLSYRQGVDPEYRDAIFRLRHDAYLREGAISPQPGGIFKDEVDQSENTLLFGIHVDDELVSSIRVSVSSPTAPDIPTAHVFPDILGPEIAAGKIIVDPTRFVVDHASSRRSPELPYITLRLAWIAMEQFDADILLAAVRSEHVAFYRRFWSTHAVAPPRTYPLLSKPISLTLADYPSVRESVHARYPLLASTAVERARIFDTLAAGQVRGLPPERSLGQPVTA